jgi:hypothetical protein
LHDLPDSVVFRSHAAIIPQNLHTLKKISGVLCQISNGASDHALTEGESNPVPRGQKAVDRLVGGGF